MVNFKYILIIMGSILSLLFYLKFYNHSIMYPVESKVSSRESFVLLFKYNCLEHKLRAVDNGSDLRDSLDCSTFS